MKDSMGKESLNETKKRKIGADRMKAMQESRRMKDRMGRESPSEGLDRKCVSE